MIDACIGFIPLLDAALLVVAREEGFAEEEGIALTLIREVSWANIRDKLHVGLFDAAHILAPAAIASSLGLAHVTVPMSVPVGLNLNGNAITVSRGLYDELIRHADGDLSVPAVSARALKAAVAARAGRGEPPPTFAHTFPFSTHHYHLRIWMKAGGVNPEEDVRLVVIPPPLMAKTLESGHIDGFCVGAPWNALVIAEGDAVILHVGTQIVADGPEKMLGMLGRTVEAQPDLAAGLVRAILKAGAWCSDASNRPILARHMARADILGVRPSLLEQILDGRLPIGRAAAEPHAGYIRFDPAALRPAAAQADFLLEQMHDAGQVALTESAHAAARATFGAGVFDAASDGAFATGAVVPRIVA